ncbi:MAG TPA: DMT family transporter [Prolixibacteraceae bacterium]
MGYSIDSRDFNPFYSKSTAIFDPKICALENQLLSSHLKLHFIVLIYGFTAILGKLISLPAAQLVWYRMLIAVIAFYLFIRWNKTDLSIDFKQFFKLFGIGIIVAIHWITFFGAIKISNVSVTLGCLATVTLFTSLLEPFFFRKRINAVEVIVGLLIIIGLYLIFRFETRYSLGIIVALISAFLAGLFTVINKKMVIHQKATVISFYEMLGGLTGITIYLLFTGTDHTFVQLPSPIDFVYLLVLGIICTAYAFAIQVDVMKHLSAYIVALTINLEPVYGIILAYFIFGETEHMTGGFYFGTAIILTSVLGFPIYHYYLRRRSRLPIKSL